MSNQELKMPERKGKFKELNTGVLHHHNGSTVSPRDVEYIKTKEYVGELLADGEVYFNREQEGKTPSCFKDCIVYDKEGSSDK